MTEQITADYLKLIGEYQENNRFFKRGDVWKADLGSIMINSTTNNTETAGYRPVIILQNDVGNKYSDYVIVAVISSSVNKITKQLPTQVIIQLDKPSVVLTECIRTIHKDKLCKFCCHVSPEDMAKIDLAMMKSLGLIRL